MNWAYLHLLTNHFPIMVTAFGILVLVCALVTRRRAIWMFTLATFAVAGLSAGPIYLFGDQAGDQVEALKVVDEHRIDAHEDAAEWALWVLLGMGVLSAYGFWRMRRKPESEQPPQWLQGVVILAVLLGMSVLTRTAYLGGKIAHGDNTLTGPPSVIATPPAPGGEREH
jgi:uncharacterized membrane protein